MFFAQGFDLFQEKISNPYIRRIPCGSFSGYGTARDLAKLMGILANGGSHNGKSYLSPRTVKLLTEVLTPEDRPELCLGNTVLQFGRGTTPFKTPVVSILVINAVDQ